MREQIDILEGIWGDEAVHASTASHGDETPKNTKYEPRPNRNKVPPEGQRRRAETVDFVDKGEPRTENAIENFGVGGGDEPGGAEMDEGEGRKICDGEEIRIPEGWRQRLEGRRERKARRSRRFVDLIQP